MTCSRKPPSILQPHHQTSWDFHSSWSWIVWWSGDRWHMTIHFVSSFLFCFVATIRIVFRIRDFCMSVLDLYLFKKAEFYPWAVICSFVLPFQTQTVAVARSQTFIGVHQTMIKPSPWALWDLDQLVGANRSSLQTDQSWWHSNTRKPLQIYCFFRNWGFACFSGTMLYDLVW